MTTTRHRSLVERGRRKSVFRDTGLAHTHRRGGKKILRKTSVFANSKKKFVHIELLAKLLDYLLRSNKSNINQ